MIRNARLLVAFALALVIAACSDGPTAAGDAIVRHRGGAPVLIEPGTCITLAELQTLAAEVFGAGSPDYNSVRGKLDNLQHQIELGNTVETKGKAHDIVDFVLTKNEENALPGQESLVEFVNGVYCFAGLDITMSDPSNSHLIFPDDQEQVVVSADEQSGIRFDAFPVNAPTLITFIPEVSAPLNTKLDQYPGFFSITAQADAEVILTRPATVGVCAQGVIPPEVRARLRLGHGLKTAEEATDYQGFEITPAADASFLQCANEIAVVPSSIGSRLWSRVASLMLPAKAHAYQESFGGGVGGTVTEFSPFAPVDPELNFGGGVGGTVTEFMRTWSSKSLLSGDQALAVGGCSTIQAPIGSPVRSDCLPLVSVRTRLGTLFENVPINWNVGLGGGTIAARTAGSCGTLGASVADVTDALGISDICWTLGAEGANTVVATPALGGDAVDGVIFSPASRTFSATANPPSALAFTQQPSSTTAGAPISLQVEVRDLNGERVIGYNGNVSVAIATGPAGATLGGTTTERADAGLATFDALVITKAGDYTLDVDRAGQQRHRRGRLRRLAGADGARDGRIWQCDRRTRGRVDRRAQQHELGESRLHHDRRERSDEHRVDARRRSQPAARGARVGPGRLRRVRRERHQHARGTERLRARRREGSDQRPVQAVRLLHPRSRQREDHPADRALLLVAGASQPADRVRGGAHHAARDLRSGGVPPRGDARAREPSRQQ
jgi:hypothetical protein